MPLRRTTTTLALAGAALTLGVTPAAAMPIDPTGAAEDRSATQAQPPLVVREVAPPDDDAVLPVVLSGAALLVALGSAGYAGRTRRRIGEPSH